MIENKDENILVLETTVSEPTDDVIATDDSNNSEEENSGIKFKLENFEGPLDLIVHLIKESKMDINDIKISQITTQYLEYMRAMEEMDFEISASFLEMAAILVDIKTKQLLPAKEEDLIEGEEADPAELLKQRIKEYNLFKEASQSLKELENTDIFYKEPDKAAGDFRIVLKQMNLDKLITAFTKMMS